MTNSVDEVMKGFTDRIEELEALLKKIEKKIINDDYKDLLLLISKYKEKYLQKSQW